MKSIIIVDDFEDITLMIKHVLELADITNVYTTSDPAEAISYTIKNGRPLLIVTGYDMQQTTGSQLLLNINNLYPGTPGIIMTSDPQRANADDDTKGIPVIYKNESGFLNKIVELAQEQILLYGCK